MKPMERAAAEDEGGLFPRWAALLVLLLPCGCAAGMVTGQIQPMHFQFVTVVPQRKPGAGGWRAACVHAWINNGTSEESYLCRLGVEMPLENGTGPISTPLAQRIAADCANEAAYAILSVAADSHTPPLLYTLCQSLISEYGMILNAAAIGSRVSRICDKRAEPIIFGDFPDTPPTR